jgi:hypothetical protein
MQSVKVKTVVSKFLQKKFRITHFLSSLDVNNYLPHNEIINTCNAILNDIGYAGFTLVNDENYKDPDPYRELLRKLTKRSQNKQNLEPRVLKSLENGNQFA